MHRDSNTAQGCDVWVVLGSDRPLGREEIYAISVHQDLNQPDVCVLSVRNSGHRFSNTLVFGDEVEVKMGGEDGTTMLEGRWWRWS